MATLLKPRRNATEEFVKKGVRPGEDFRVGAIRPEVRLAPIKRVAIFAEAFLPKIDGVSKTAVLVARHLMNTQREVLIFAPDNNGYTPKMLDKAPVITVPSWGLPFVPETKVGFPAPMVTTHLDEFQPDMIHLFSPAVLSVAGVLFGTNRRVPVVANYQTDLPGYSARYGYSLLSNTIRDGLRVMHNRAHLTLVPSHTIIRQLKEWGFRRLRLWTRGVDSQMFTPQRRSAEMRQRLLAGRPDSSLLVIYVGRLATEKRVDLLREVAKLPGVALTIVGDGAQREELEAMFGGQAHFTGYMFGEELATAYASADLFAFTGTNETFGQVVTEAMASGLPVLVPNAGGVVDLVLDGMNGYICQEDPDDYRNRVAWMRDHPERRQRMSELALEYTHTRPWESLMEELEEHYWEAWRLNQRLKTSEEAALRLFDDLPARNS
jgi:glycosyltransferase involved in cell wall biosynthesis